ncbi:Ppx/GppA phosphatase family protein [Neopusillimonas maritima]|uniref:Exopolyphosphatase n=1 Tax=Neopusillimonas maritima TaxID=2026239 RepID=A0A3A1YV52_9BURK|nr:Ppx/GppA phosphatase family protein [Neopusillimonas maritima]RIY40710.1 exopolyphosphatase [Neopusillimonas maritima]
MDHLLAAVDLGSNSFRLSIGRVVQQDNIAHIYAVDRLKESVRLAAGLGPDNRLDNASIERALTILRRYGERLKGFDPDRVRAVATSTFRVARNVDEILSRAEEALGFPIEVISGQEEARLIFSGVANELPPSDNKRLVIDIGGGSTEVIIGKSFEPMQLSSLLMGCVSYTQKYFPDGVVSGERMDKAVLAARREFEGVAKRFRKMGWQEAYGSSGTAKGLFAVLTDSHMSRQGITLDGLEKLRRKLVEDRQVIVEELPGLKESRAAVLPGGLAIMLAAFYELGIEVMMQGEGALRVGVLYDLLGRESKHDKRDETVRQFMRRYHIDQGQATRVRACALHLFNTIPVNKEEKEDLQKWLGWAADLHELGMSITAEDYHKHGAYILKHADMPGFSTDEQAIISWFTLGHSGKLRKLKAYRPTWGQWVALLCMRLSALLMRPRENLGRIPLSLMVKGRALTITINAAWLKAHPLTEYSLQNEVNEWEKTGFKIILAAQ